MYRHVSSIFQFPWHIRVITKLPNSEQSYKGKVKTRCNTHQDNFCAVVIDEVHMMSEWFVL
jgi:hypothetical protein